MRTVFWKFRGGLEIHASMHADLPDEARELIQRAFRARPVLFQDDPDRQLAHPYYIAAVRINRSYFDSMLDYAVNLTNSPK